MWYIFFATGDINALKAAFEVSGNESASHDLQVAASDQFANFRDEYIRRINEALDHDSEYFRNHETVHGLPDHENMMLETATVFDRFQKMLDSATKELDRLKDEDEAIIAQFTHTGGADAEDTKDAKDTDATQAFVNELIGGDEDDADPERERMLEMSSRFDEIARDVLGKRYVTKSADE
jgi:hypothetical protein